MYVERLAPAEVTQPLPILFIHRTGMMGTNLLNIPDGRLGWADYFLGQGYEALLTCTSSTNLGEAGLPGSPASMALFLPRIHYGSTIQVLAPGSASHAVAREWISRFYASNVISLDSSAEEGYKIKHASSQLLPVILMTHSQAGEFGWILGDARPNQVKAIVALEPTDPPFINAIFPSFNPVRIHGLTDIPITYNPPTLRLPT
ncbi:hypothetical protein DFH07DRAFT_405262 [Mycena maculata]|uniref:Uncharacterized protein n=1 Tax=Mycena maculata TaxID=230809 RepID=A0AAD7JDW1_9AGAR|nr:hypothetical protein DFH07DRAFT_405262 [Mycena maculata]